HSSAGKLTVAGNLRREGLASILDGLNATGRSSAHGEGIAGSDYRHSVDWLPRHPVSACGVELVFTRRGFADNVLRHLRCRGYNLPLHSGTREICGETPHIRSSQF